MSKVEFCPCTDTGCQFNPANHDQGCNLCVEDSLKCGEIPKCFFLKVVDSVEGFEDWSFEHFAKLVLNKNT